MSGFIAMQREALDHPLLKDGERFRAWFWMVAKACWRPTKHDLNGKTITVERGQFVASRAQLAQAWGWSPSAVERFLTRLQTEQMIGRATGQGRSVITIENYDKYQDGGEQTGQAPEQPTGQRSDSDRTTKEQGNKGTITSSEVKTKARARKAPIPDDWTPSPFTEGTESRKVEDGWPPGERSAQIEQFKAHHRAKGNSFTDPQSAWSTWVLNSRKFGNGRQNHRPERPTTRQLGERVAARFSGGSGGTADSLPRLGSSGGYG